MICERVSRIVHRKKQKRWGKGYLDTSQAILYASVEGFIRPSNWTEVGIAFAVTASAGMTMASH
jgi:Uri superfamily endonuclease